MICSNTKKNWKKTSSRFWVSQKEDTSKLLQPIFNPKLCQRLFLLLLLWLQRSIFLLLETIPPLIVGPKKFLLPNKKSIKFTNPFWVIKNKILNKFLFGFFLYSKIFNDKFFFDCFGFNLNLPSLLLQKLFKNFFFFFFFFFLKKKKFYLKRSDFHLRISLGYWQTFFLCFLEFFCFQNQILSLRLKEIKTNFFHLITLSYQFHVKEYLIWYLQLQRWNLDLKFFLKRFPNYPTIKNKKKFILFYLFILFIYFFFYSYKWNWSSQDEAFHFFFFNFFFFFFFLNFFFKNFFKNFYLKNILKTFSKQKLIKEKKCRNVGHRL